jgi:hypothetical protein
MSLTAADDRRHSAAAGARARDSLFWQATLPEQRLGLQLYLPIGGRRAGWNLAVWGEGIGGPALELGSAELAPDTDLDDLDAGGVRVMHGKPLQTVRLLADTPRIQLDAEFVGRHPAYSYRDSPGGLPGWFAIDRFEQSGWLTGNLRVDGRELRLDTAAHRDHSWGSRDWRMPQHWTWFVAYAGDRSVNGWIWIAGGTWGFAGYVADGATVTPVDRIEHTIRFDEHYDQQALDAVLIDTTGRRTSVRLESFGVLRLPDERSGSEVREAACAGWIDGAQGAGQLECEWPIAYLEHLAS